MSECPKCRANTLQTSPDDLVGGYIMYCTDVGCGYVGEPQFLDERTVNEVKEEIRQEFQGHGKDQ